MKPSKQSSGSPSIEDESLSGSFSSTREDEKTIPFLRRLTDMLMENEDVISFNPGHRNNGKVVLGRIEVHDRVKVESSILPKYFNHSSFASLRRQLNYFSFTRIGKGRQRGATYCNEGVVFLNDILTLKRRSAVNQGAVRIIPSLSSSTGVVDLNHHSLSAKAEKPSIKSGIALTGNVKGSEDRRPSEKRSKDLVTSTKKMKRSNKRHRVAIASETILSPRVTSGPGALLPSRVSPVDHSVMMVGESGSSAKRISLDLTGYNSPESFRSFASISVGPPDMIYTDSSSMVSGASTVGFGDDDILAGCQALLCFSRGTPGISSR